MSKLIATIPLFLVTCCAWAAAMEDAANAPPVEGVSMVYVVLFLVLFAGGIIGFLLYMWWLDRQKKADGK